VPGSSRVFGLHIEVLFDLFFSTKRRHSEGCHFATLLGGLLLGRLVQVDIAVEGASVLALQALLLVLSLSVVPGAILVVNAALLVAAVVSRPNAVLVVALLFEKELWSCKRNKWC
jgi:hypothetical protein